MKFFKYWYVLILMLVWLPFSCFAQYVLCNIPEGTVMQAYKYSPSCFGYYTGHNCYGRDIYAEKYYINGSVSIIGVASIHTGIVQMQDRMCAFELYTVGPDYLPYERLVTKNTTYGDIRLNGDSTITLFDSPIEVKDSFFVAWSILNYAHEPFTDTIGLLCGTNGSRPDNDLIHYGRNSVKLHDIGWADFNLKTALKTNLAIFPILSSIPTSILNSNNSSIDVNIIYSNTNLEFYYILKSPSKVIVDIYEITGRLIKHTDLGYKFQGENLDELRTDELKLGIYTLVFHTDQGITVKKILINE